MVCLNLDKKGYIVNNKLYDTLLQSFMRFWRDIRSTSLISHQTKLLLDNQADSDGPIMKALKDTNRIDLHLETDSRIQKETTQKDHLGWKKEDIQEILKSKKDNPPSTFIEDWSQMQAQILNPGGVIDLLDPTNPDKVLGKFASFSDEQIVAVLSMIENKEVSFWNNATGDDLDRLVNALKQGTKLPETVEPLDYNKSVKTHNTLIIHQLKDNEVHMTTWCRDIDSWVYIDTLVFDKQKASDES